VTSHSQHKYPRPNHRSLFDGTPTRSVTSNATKPHQRSPSFRATGVAGSQGTQVSNGQPKREPNRKGLSNRELIALLSISLPPSVKAEIAKEAMKNERLTTWRWTIVSIISSLGAAAALIIRAR